MAALPDDIGCTGVRGEVSYFVLYINPFLGNKTLERARVACLANGFRTIATMANKVIAVLVERRDTRSVGDMGKRGIRERYKAMEDRLGSFKKVKGCLLYTSNNQIAAYAIASHTTSDFNNVNRFFVIEINL